LNPAYWVDFFKHAASENEPPRIKFAMNGPDYTGPPVVKTVGHVDCDGWPAARSHGVGRRSTADTRLRYDTPVAMLPAPAPRVVAARRAAVISPEQAPPAFIGGRLVQVDPAATPAGGAAAAEAVVRAATSR
jgi:hypothetical protein